MHLGVFGVKKLECGDMRWRICDRISFWSGDLVIESDSNLLNGTGLILIAYFWM